MINMEQGEIVKRIASTVKNKDPNAVAYLFGSRARGNYRADSDWDILILVDGEKVTNEIEDRFRDGLYDIELESGQIISAFIYSKDFWHSSMRHSPLFKSIRKEGLRL